MLKMYICMYLQEIRTTQIWESVLHSYISDTLPIFLSYLVFVWLDGNGMHSYDN